MEQCIFKAVSNLICADALSFVDDDFSHAAASPDDDDRNAAKMGTKQHSLLRPVEFNLVRFCSINELRRSY